MLGDQIGEERGQSTGRRVLPGAGGATMEVSFEASGKFLGVATTDTGTYSAVLRPDGTLEGQGQGIIMGAGGEVATWKGSGVGKMVGPGAVSWRGSLLYQSPTPAWARLNGTVGLFEYEVAADGATLGKIWEWK
ncbi:MAG: hypothetical protein HYY05_01570 [Chloroflexi bacterium]|nr:hypothetical protein [Chloroflexota bacterium]